MRAQQLDIASERAFAIFRMVYEKVFEKKAEERYLEYWTRSINDDETQNGADIGALDFSYFSNVAHIGLSGSHSRHAQMSGTESATAIAT